MNKCIMSTDPLNPFHLPGENHQCDRRGFYRIPGELGEYFLDGLVCKQHLKLVTKHGHEWAETFKNMGVGKKQKIQDLQNTYRNQSIFSELH